MGALRPEPPREPQLPRKPNGELGPLWEFTYLLHREIVEGRTVGESRFRWLIGIQITIAIALVTLIVERLA